MNSLPSINDWCRAKVIWKRERERGKEREREKEREGGRERVRNRVWESKMISHSDNNRRELAWEWGVGFSSS